MQDILKKYKKNRLISHVWIVVTSLVMAIGINFLLVDGTNIWQTLKASVLNSNGIKIDSDIYIEKTENSFDMLSSKQINSVKSLTLSLAYNPENISINNFTSENAEIVNLNNTPWINSLIIHFNEAKNIDPKWTILTLDFQKKNNKSENINVMNANFTDSSWENYLLTTSWLTF